MIDRFGAQGVYGRPLTRAEMRRILLAETVARAYRERGRAESIAEWATANPELQEMLVKAQRAAGE